MPNEIRVTVIGGGSTYTPELMEGFIESWTDLPVHRITLMDIDGERLAVLGGLADRMVRAAGVPIEVTTTQDQRRAIEGSDFVISQIRVGGMAARLLDETIPPQFGVIGQETTGPGGFAKAMRTIPVALRIARDIQEVAPGAFLVNFTNPAGLITEALLRYSPVRTIGLCNLPIGTEMRLSKRLGVDRTHLSLDWVGLNHLNWTRGAALDGKDVWPKVFEEELQEAEQRSEDGWGFSASLLDSLGMIPCGYLNYYYNHDRMLAKQRSAGQTRAEEVQDIERQLLAMFQDPGLKEKPRLLEKRGGAYYSKVAVSLLSAIVNSRREIHIVNTQNRGAIPDLPSHAVVEVPCVIDAAGARPLVTSPLPAKVRGLVQAVKAYEELAVEAGAEGDPQKALQALLAHPLTPSFDAAKGLLQALFDAHRRHLPQFFGAT